ncbi:OmpA family protein [Echinicola jeungdonensis]|uniref:OmpA family protein n=1 Tax=Echinicola jeungdonensis TaxID=709343 RepID=A0ABV5J618_9BACT|nr:OmpA family protein [Echinicola jeungdonensis]MDN3670921.1 OmpA family protein [Echinicola jeungdonensis]
MKNNKKSILLKAGILQILAFCVFLPSYGQGIYSLKEVNSSYDEQHPVLSPNEELYFTVAHHEKNKRGEKDLGDVWFSSKNDFNQWQDGQPIADLSTDGYDVLIGFSSSNSVLVYHDGNGNKSHGIYEYKRKGESNWEMSQAQNFGSFRNKSNYFGARLHGSGEIMVLSMESYGSYGNEDIYVSFKKENGRWSMPQNLGPKVNSFQQEMTPFLSEDTQILYFSSNGHGSKGARDIFYSQRLDDSWENWTEPTRLSDKTNTPGMELSYFIPSNNPYTAYYTTTQNSEGYGDIMMLRAEEITRKEIPKGPELSNTIAENQLPIESEIATTSVSEMEQENSKNKFLSQGPEPVQTGEDINQDLEKNQEENQIVPVYSDNEKTAKIKVLDASTKSPITYTISYRNEIGETTASQQVEKTEGEFPLGSNAERIKITAPNYLPYSVSVESFTQNVEIIYLTRVSRGASIVLDDILFKRGTSTLADQGSKEAILDLVEFMEEHPEVKIKLEGHTDNVGNSMLNKELSLNRAGAIRDFMVDQGIAFERIMTAGWGGRKPIASNDTEQGRKLNRRVEMIIMD